MIDCTEEKDTQGTLEEEYDGDQIAPPDWPNIHDSRSNSAPHPYELIKPVIAFVREQKAGFVASFLDADVHVSGDTIAEAVTNLADMMVHLLNSLGKEKRLGKIPARQLAVLREFIHKVG